MRDGLSAVACVGRGAVLLLRVAVGGGWMGACWLQTVGNGIHLKTVSFKLELSNSNGTPLELNF